MKGKPYGYKIIDSKMYNEKQHIFHQGAFYLLRGYQYQIPDTFLTTTSLRSIPNWMSPRFSHRRMAVSIRTTLFSLLKCEIKNALDLFVGIKSTTSSFSHFHLILTELVVQGI